METELLESARAAGNGEKKKKKKEKRGNGLGSQKDRGAPQVGKKASCHWTGGGTCSSSTR